MMAVRKVCGREREFASLRESQEAKPRWARCRRGFEDCFSEGFRERMDEFVVKGHGLIRCYSSPTTGGLGDAYDRDDWREIEPSECDGCRSFDQKGVPLPLMAEDILVEQPEIGECIGAEIGAIVVVKPCDPVFEGKTYLGVLVGEMPTQIGLQCVGGELMVVQEWSNPLIVIPSESAVVYGYESWWKVVRDDDDLGDITDAEILSQPYMAALLKSIQGD